MKVTDGTPWTITCTENFEETVSFFRDVIGISVADQGVPSTDKQFTRFAQIKMPNGSVLEIVEPSQESRKLYTSPVFSITVDDVVQARHEMEIKQIAFVAPIFYDNQGWCWTYFRAPDGNIYQIQGPDKEKRTSV